MFAAERSINNFAIVSCCETTTNGPRNCKLGMRLASRYGVNLSRGAGKKGDFEFTNANNVVLTTSRSASSSALVVRSRGGVLALVFL